MGHIAHLGYILERNVINIIQVGENSLLHPPSFENSVVLHLSKLESPSPLKARMLMLSFFFLNLALWFWGRKLLNIGNLFLPFCYYTPLEKGVVLRLNNFKSPSRKDALCLAWVKLVLWLWKRRFLNVYQIYPQRIRLGPLFGKT